MSNLNQLIETIIEDAKKQGYCVFGLRQHHERAKVGDYTENSYSYFQDQDQEVEMLDGTCAIELFDIDDDDFEDQLKCFMDSIDSFVSEENDCKGDVLLLAGTTYEYGEEDLEIIIPQAKVIWVK